MASIALAGGLGHAGCCIPAVEPTTPPPTSAPAPTEPDDLDSDDGEPVDEPPFHPTPLPPYVEGPVRIEGPSITRVLEEATHEMPQRADATALFARARPVEGTIERGLFVCRASVRGSFDDSFFAGGADVAMSMTIGQRVSMNAGQRSSRTFTFPIASLDPGTTISVGLVDVDVLFHDPIANGSVSWERAPFTIEHPSAVIECRALANVEAEAQRALGTFRRALDAFSASRPELLEADLGFPSTERVRDAAEGAASWLGWNDSEVQAGFARARELDAAYVTAVGARVAEVREELPPMSEGVVAGDRRLRIARVICDDDARAMRREMNETTRRPACHVVLEIEALRTTRLAAPDGRGYEAWAMSEDGLRESTERLGMRCGETWTRPFEPHAMQRGDRCDVHLAVSAPPAILRVGGTLASRPVLLRLD